ncbi:MAG: outer membrane lipoprotein carrier protein LolA [Acidobacteria bacterium]|nr:outer membrane lipoprotein carrier protein LolA [Acidobacteriota bacterium]
MYRRLTLIFCLLLGTSVAATAEWDSDTLIERLNEAAKHFRTVSAKLEYTKVTVVVDDKSTQTGELFYHKDGSMLIEIRQPEVKEILFRGNKAEIFYPKMNQIQEYDLAKHRSLVEQFLLLGFGTSGDDLKKSYLITVLGETKLEGRAALQLELTPKDERIRNQIHKIHLWLDLASWAPVQQEFFEVGGDYMTTRYTDVKVNIPIPKSKLRLSAPKGAVRIKPRA